MQRRKNRNSRVEKIVPRFGDVETKALVITFTFLDDEVTTLVIIGDFLDHETATHML